MCLNTAVQYGKIALGLGSGLEIRPSPFRLVVKMQSFLKALLVHLRLKCDADVHHPSAVALLTWL